MKKVIILLLIITLLGSAAMLLKKRRQKIENAATPTPLTYQVKVVPATTQQLEQTRPFLARLASRETAEISSKLSGRIKAVLVKENQPVKEGDRLLQIDDREISASIQSLQVSLEAQEKDVQYTKTSMKETGLFLRWAAWPGRNLKPRKQPMRLNRPALKLRARRSPLLKFSSVTST